MKIFAEVQKIGKALMTPVAILPAAGLFLAFGNKLQFTLMEQAGQVIFSNLPLLFAIGAAIGLVGGDGVAALSAVVAILIMNTTMGIVSGAAEGIAAGNMSYAMVLGIPTLQTGVFGVHSRAGVDIGNPKQNGNIIAIITMFLLTGMISFVTNLAAGKRQGLCGRHIFENAVDHLSRC